MKKSKYMPLIMFFLMLFSFTILKGNTNDEILNQYTIQVLAEDKPAITNKAQEKVLSGYTFYVDEQVINTQEEIINYKQLIYVPLRAVSDILGANIYYVNTKKVAIINNENTRIEIPVGYNKGIIINKGTTAKISLFNEKDQEAISLIYNNKIYIPIRFIAENLGYEVNHIQNKKQIKFSALKDHTTAKVNRDDQLDKRIEIKYDGTAGFKYLKPSRAEDVRRQMVTIDNDTQVEVKYIANQVIFLTNQESSFKEVKKMLEKYDGVIVGYLAKTRYYQVEFRDCTYKELQDKIKKLSKEELVKPQSIGLNYVEEVVAN